MHMALRMHDSKPEKLIICNWKAYLGVEESVKLSAAIADAFRESRKAGELAIAPALPAIQPVGKEIADAGISLCAQNLDLEEKGAHTGSITISMLEELGCKYALLGHSELRYREAPEPKESEELISRKADACLRASIMPVLCVGETAEEKRMGRAEGEVRRQIEAALDKISDISKDRIEKLVVAYEPVWAISSSWNSRAPEPAEINNAIETIRNSLHSLLPKEKAERIRILYGGSVSQANAAGYMAAEGISGLLIGSASTDQKKLRAILEAVSYI